MADIQSLMAEITRGKKKKEEERKKNEERKTGPRFYVRICYAGRS